MRVLTRRNLNITGGCVIALITAGLYIYGISYPETIQSTPVLDTAITSSSYPGRIQSPRFKPLPLGNIVATGWLRKELEASANGLAGHEYDFYQYVAQSPWLGGNREYAKLNEGFPYWFNGLVYLAYGLQDDRLKSQVHEAADFVLDHQQADGWIGPETDSETRIFWGRYPFFLGLIGLAEANSTWTSRVVTSLHSFADFMHSMLKNDGQGFIWHDGDKMTQRDYSWGQSRGADMVITLIWLLQNDPKGRKEALLETAKLLHQMSVHWESWYNEASYMKEDFQHMRGDLRPYFEFKHGVNVAQGLKSPAVFWQLTSNDSLVATARNAVDWTFKHHGTASGTIIADDTIRGQLPFAGAELCTTVEAMFSLSYLYQIFGVGAYADRCEKAAFNALPAMVTTDWWAHQYMQQANQPFSKKLEVSPFGNTNAWAQTFGLEPNLPCCTLNHPQGLPKFLAASYVGVGLSGLAHVLLGPAKVNVTLPSGAHVIVECVTAYPFSDDLHYSIVATEGFDFYIRVPDWSSHEYTIKVAGLDTQRSVDQNTGLFRLDLPSGKSDVSIRLFPKVVLERRPNDTVAITRGALVYALGISAEISSTLPKDYKDQRPFEVDYAPEEVRDYTMINTSSWNMAIDPSTIESHIQTPFRLEGPTFAAGKSSQTLISVKGCQIEWPLYKDSIPDTPPPADRRVCTGEPSRITLVPFGSAKLHMVDLPTIDLA